MEMDISETGNIGTEGGLRTDPHRNPMQNLGHSWCFRGGCDVP